MTLLKLLAMDDEDLEIISAHLQDSVIKVGDIEWMAKEGHFLLALNRFGWEETLSGGIIQRHKNKTRHRSLLRFDRVLKVATRGIDRNRKDDVLSLLTIQFLPKDLPAGIITLIFSGEAAIRLDVECIEAQLSDLGSAWQARSRPTHK